MWALWKVAKLSVWHETITCNHSDLINNLEQTYTAGQIYTHIDIVTHACTAWSTYRTCLEIDDVWIVTRSRDGSITVVGLIIILYIKSVALT
jgi:hypothetical protein